MALKAALQKYASAEWGDGLHATPVGGLSILKASRALCLPSAAYRSSFCIVAQGAKQLSFDGGIIDCSEMQSVMLGLDLPASGIVTRASADRPYLSVMLNLDASTLRSVMEHLDPPPSPAPGPRKQIRVENVASPLADCLARLVRMAEMPRAIPILRPSIMNEIAYWLLTGPNADEVCRPILRNGETRRIADAIQLLRADLTRSVRIVELAAAAGMSESAFYQHFRLMTGLTPLQYQKQLRLLAARRMLQSGERNVTSAAYRVGYRSASQFSREFKRMFGTSPKREARS